MTGHFVTTSNSPNATASMNSVSSAFRHWAIFASAVNRKITSEVGRRLMTSASCNLLSGSVINGIIKEFKMPTVGFVSVIQDQKVIAANQ